MLYAKKNILINCIVLLACLASNKLWAENIFTLIEESRDSIESRDSSTETVRNDDSVISSTRYAVKSDAINSSSKELGFNLASGPIYQASKILAKQNDQGNLVWRGKIGDSNESADTLDSEYMSSSNSVILVKTPLGITGTLRAEGRLFKIRPSENGTHIVEEIDESLVPDDHPIDAYIEHETSNQTTIENDSDMQDASIEAVPEIHLLVAYSDEVKRLSGDIDGLIQLSIEETNAGFGNSDVNAKVKLVHTYQASFTDGSISQVLNEFRGKGDGIMEEVHGKRDQYGADVAVLLSNPSSGCGIARINAVASTSFTVVKYSCSTGNYSFGHELGHIFGARHNPERDSSTNPYAFGHGYLDPAGNWRTIMSYNDCASNCPRINWWSNPSKKRGGVNMGTSSTSDNARVLNLRASTVAGFKASVGGGGGSSKLTNNVAKSGLSASRGSEKRYYIDVPTGAKNLTFTLSGGSGDADLYVQFGSQPNLESRECRPYKNGNNESCEYANPNKGRYHVMLHAYRDYANTTLRAKFETASGGSTIVNACAAGLSFDSRIEVGKAMCLPDTDSGRQLQMALLVSNGDAGKTLRIRTAHGSGNSDIFVRHGGRPKPPNGDYDKKTNGAGTTETLLLPSVKSGWNYIHVYGTSSFSGATILADFEP